MKYKYRIVELNNGNYAVQRKEKFFFGWMDHGFTYYDDKDFPHYFSEGKLSECENYIRNVERSESDEKHKEWLKSIKKVIKVYG